MNVKKSPILFNYHFLKAYLLMLAIAWAGSAESASAAGFHSCSTTQQSFAGPAVSEALTFAIGAYENLKTPQPNPTYSEWFGSSTPARLSTVQGHFGALRAALTIGVLDLTCSCSAEAEKMGTRAYAIVDKPYKVFLCTAFFGLHSNPGDGFDTRGGIILHEVSHFAIVNDLLDGLPGVSQARQRAANYPDRAIRSAYNHAFYAEAVAGAH